MTMVSNRVESTKKTTTASYPDSNRIRWLDAGKGKKCRDADITQTVVIRTKNKSMSQL